MATLKIKQDRFETVEEFKNELRDVLYSVLDFARRGEEKSMSELANDLYVVEFLIRDCEITVE